MDPLQQMQAGAAKALHTRDIKSGLDVSDEAVTGAWASVRDDANPVTWATFTYGCSALLRYDEQSFVGSTYLMTKDSEVALRYICDTHCCLGMLGRVRRS